MGRKRSQTPTMNDIAAAAGCSQTTVSFVLNNVPGHSIPEETRRRVAEAAVALGYSARAEKPKPSAARSGRVDRSGQSSKPRSTTARAAAISYTDKVARAIAIDILSGRFPEDRTLPPDLDLSSRFGVSRTVLREAVRVLTGKGLLEAKPGVGTKVRQRSQWHIFDPDVLIWQADAGLGKEFMRHLGEMRLILEPEAAALAARRHADFDVDNLFRLTERMAARGIVAEAFARADLEFHLAVSAGSGNPFLSAISALIEVSLTASLRRSWPGDDPGGSQRSAMAHRAIAEAISVGDSEAARAAMREVINEGINRSVRR